MSIASALPQTFPWGQRRRSRQDHTVDTLVRYLLYPPGNAFTALSNWPLNAKAVAQHCHLDVCWHCACNYSRHRDQLIRQSAKQLTQTVEASDLRPIPLPHPAAPLHVPTPGWTCCTTPRPPHNALVISHLCPKRQCGSAAVLEFEFLGTG